jgi:hypothetical protein
MELPGDYAKFERFNIELTTYPSEFGRSCARKASTV